MAPPGSGSITPVLLEPEWGSLRALLGVFLFDRRIGMGKVLYRLSRILFLFVMAVVLILILFFLKYFFNLGN